MAGTAWSRSVPKNSRQTVRTWSGIRCKMKRAEVMMPSQPSFCTPGRPDRNLSVTSLPSPSLRKALPGISSSSGPPFGVTPSAAKRLTRKRTSSASWILPRLCPMRSTSSQSASGVTMRHEARLSSAVPHSTAFLPPAFMATLPPMQEASWEVGSTANARPLASARSDTRRVTTPAPQRTVGTVWSTSGRLTRSTPDRSSSFSVLITAVRASSGTAEPV